MDKWKCRIYIQKESIGEKKVKKVKKPKNNNLYNILSILNSTYSPYCLFFIQQVIHRLSTGVAFLQHIVKMKESCQCV